MAGSRVLALSSTAVWQICNREDSNQRLSTGSHVETTQLKCETRECSDLGGKASW